MATFRFFCNPSEMVKAGRDPVFWIDTVIDLDGLSQGQRDALASIIVDAKRRFSDYGGQIVSIHPDHTLRAANDWNPLTLIDQLAAETSGHNTADAEYLAKFTAWAVGQPVNVAINYSRWHEGTPMHPEATYWYCPDRIATQCKDILRSVWARHCPAV